MTDAVIMRVEQGVGELTLNRPAVLNALNPEMARALHQAVLAVEDDEDVQCVVLRGAGEHFMSGGDVGFFRDSLDEFKHHSSEALADIFEDVHGTIRAIRRMDKPVVASARGAIAGFGVSLLAACDLAVVADDAVLTLAYCHIGVSPDGGSTYFLPRMIGAKRAMELALLGDRFDAVEAKTIGLINRVVTVDELEEVTQQLTQRLATGPALAYANTKALLNASLRTDLDAQLDSEQACFTECVVTEDFAEGVNAFCEKRRPHFGGT